MSTKTDRHDRSRRLQAIWLTVLVGIFAAALVAGMIYMYYQTSRLHS